MRVRLRLLVALAALPLAVSCGDGPPVALKVATDATWPPMEFVNEAGEIAGFDIDLLRAAAAAGGFTVEFRNTSWEALFTGLAKGEYDAVISSVLITDERRRTMDFSVPYLNAGQVLVVRSESRATRLADLAGRTVAAQIGTRGALEVEKVKGVTLRTYDEIGPAMDDLAAARVEAVVCDLPTAAAHVMHHQAHRGRLKTVGEALTHEPCGVAVRKGNSRVLRRIDAGLRKVLDSPDYQRLKSRWLP